MLRALVLISVSAVAATLCVAQQAATNSPTAQPAVNEAQGSLLVTVLCADTNKPARGATVYVGSDRKGSTQDQNAVQIRMTTDSEGRAVFEGLEPGDYSILAELYGYIRGAVGESSSTKPETAPDVSPSTPQSHATVYSERQALSTITLIRGATLSGRVLYDDGSPAIRAQMLIEDASIKIGERSKEDLNPTHRITLTDINGYKADDQGNFRLSGLRPGTYRVAAMPNFQPETSVSGLRGAFAVFSEETLHRTSAKTYTVHAGEEASGIQIVIPTTQLHRVKGVVTAEDGLPVNQGGVALLDTADETIHLDANLEKDGSFFFNSVPSGTYALTVSDAFRTKFKQPVAPDFDDAEKMNAFAEAKSSLIVNDSDLMDLHFELKEIPLPPEKPEAADNPSRR